MAANFERAGAEKHLLLTPLCHRTAGKSRPLMRSSLIRLIPFILLRSAHLSRPNPTCREHHLREIAAKKQTTKEPSRKEFCAGRKSQRKYAFFIINRRSVSSCRVHGNSHGRGGERDGRARRGEGVSEDGPDLKPLLKDRRGVGGQSVQCVQAAIQAK